MQERRWPRVVKPPIRLGRKLIIRMVKAWIARPSRAARRGRNSDRRKVTIPIWHAYGMGGTINTVFNLAGYLARDYEVELVSLIRRRKEPFFPIPPGVTVRSLHDETDEGPAQSRLRRWLTDLPSMIVHEEDGAYHDCSAWTDLQLLRLFRSLPAGSILLTTRPGLNLVAARLAPSRVVTVAQEHVSHQIHRPGIRQAIKKNYRRLDALAVLTHRDERYYAKLVKSSHTLVARIPNALPSTRPGAGNARGKIVVSAGRLAGQKRFWRLIDAFERVVAKYPDWQLRIYGSGGHHEQLQQQILDAHLYNHVYLMGRTNHLDEEFAKASLFALPSRYEGFGLVVIEAMSAGLPVVSFDSGGPAEIITHGQDGFVIPDTDTGADRPLADSLLELIEDEEKRAAMGLAATHTAQGFDIEALGQRWDELFARLRSVRS